MRARAQAGLAALAPANGLPGEITGPLADYLLGQQPPADAEATRGLLAESAPARTWAAGVADRLAGVAPSPLPEIPARRASGAGGRRRIRRPVAAAASPPPRRATSAPGLPAGDAAPPPASRLGGVLLIAAVLAGRRRRRVPRPARR